MECIRMIGYDAVHPSDFVYDVSEEHGYYLLILTHTPVRFRDGDGERIYPARHAALFSPDSIPPATRHCFLPIPGFITVRVRRPTAMTGSYFLQTRPM